MRRLAVLSILLVAAACGGGTKSVASAPTKSAASKHSAAPSTTEPATYDDFGIATAHGALCATEASTFVTAVNAYRVNALGALPKGRDAATVAQELAAPGKLQYLVTSALKSNDPHNPPAPFHWYYDTSTGNVVRGAGCF